MDLSDVPVRVSLAVTTGVGTVTAGRKAATSSLGDSFSLNAADAPLTIAWGPRAVGIVDQVYATGNHAVLFGTAEGTTIELMPWAKRLQVTWVVTGYTSFSEYWTDYAGDGTWVVSRVEGFSPPATSVERGWITSPTVSLTSIGSSSEFYITGAYFYTVPAGEIVNYVSGVQFEREASFPDVASFSLSVMLLEHVWYLKALGTGGFEESVAYWHHQTASTGTGTITGGGSGSGGAGECDCTWTRDDGPTGAYTRDVGAAGTWSRRRC